MKGTRTLMPVLALALLLPVSACDAEPPRFKADDPHSPLTLDRAIPLPDTRGRIDHLAADVAHHRLFVAEIANGTVDALDLDKGKVVGRIAGLKKPQGVGWASETQQLVVACADGSVHFYDAGLHEVGRITLGDDADDVRVDPRNGHVVIGYGAGGLAAIDPASRRVVSRLSFKGHPEGFQLSGSRAYVNVPNDGAVLSGDLDRQQILARWPTGGRHLNFPMAVAPDGASISVAFRLPATLARLDTRNGATTRAQSTCGDSDDVYLVGDRTLIVCGAGHVDVMRKDATVARVETRGGARTGLYVPELQTLFVALPDRGQGAAIWALKLER
jgi:hypothetical protein